ncbi:hypothetical protein IQ37_10110 [Chryseobacterium piperi]|uniref:Glycine zipper domain-containing protein n=1 Tax=Chryseobacterium piperi TaxID=558152 RepID=A0A086BF53_9FLAO|nr:hypothetical protein [Chryseobacterium piperi]ASW75359.1 hypothetical protein CJF12_14390 [Chryseobacterium piperi]KFF27567.1 hypothetical protein IQ37_10110 [Chryseobacterium piperi]
MKKIVLLLLFSTSLFAQKTETIELSKSIKDNKNSVKKFTVIDQRPNKEVGNVMYHKDQINIVFKDNAEKSLTDWFYKNNPEKGKDELVLLLENLEVIEDKKEKFSIGKLNFRASTFIKKEDGYHFLFRKDTVTSVSSRTTPYLAQSLSKKISLIFTDLFKNYYQKTPWEFTVSESELTDYAVLLKEKLDIFKVDKLEDGVYKDYYSFFTHKPEPGFTLKTNDKGIVTKAVKGEEKKGIRHFYAFVHNGIAYKNIPIGYVEIFKNDQGLFIEVKKSELFPETSSNGAMIGGMAGGLIGGIIGAVIDASTQSSRRGNGGSEVYLDPFTGHYILPEDFGKAK